MQGKYNVFVFDIGGDLVVDKFYHKNPHYKALRVARDYCKNPVLVRDVNVEGRYVYETGTNYTVFFYS